MRSEHPRSQPSVPLLFFLKRVPPTFSSSACLPRFKSKFFFFFAGKIGCCAIPILFGEASGVHAEQTQHTSQMQRPSSDEHSSAALLSNDLAGYFWRFRRLHHPTVHRDDQKLYGVFFSSIFGFRIVHTTQNMPTHGETLRYDNDSLEQLLATSFLETNGYFSFFLFFNLHVLVCLFVCLLDWFILHNFFTFFHTGKRVMPPPAAFSEQHRAGATSTHAGQRPASTERSGASFQRTTIKWLLSL